MGDWPIEGGGGGGGAEFMLGLGCDLWILFTLLL